MKLSKTAIALALSVALTGTLAAAPQTKATPAKSEQKAADKATTAAAKPESVKPADLPKAVSDAVMKAHPKGTIESATKSMKGSDTWYKVVVKDAGKNHTLTLDANGMAAAAAGKGKGKGK